MHTILPGNCIHGIGWIRISGDSKIKGVAEGWQATQIFLEIIISHYPKLIDNLKILYMIYGGAQASRSPAVAAEMLVPPDPREAVVPYHSSDALTEYNTSGCAWAAITAETLVFR